MPSRIKSVYPDIGTDYIPCSLAEIMEHLSDSYGLYKGKKQCDAVVLFSESKSIWAAQQNWHKKEKKQWVGKRLKLTLPIASEAGIMEEILSHGPDIEVLSPHSLRELTKSRIKQMQKGYKEKLRWLGLATLGCDRISQTDENETFFVIPNNLDEN